MVRHSLSYPVVVLIVAAGLAACGGGTPVGTESVPSIPASPTTTPAGPCVDYPRDGFVVEGSVANATGLPTSVAAHVIWVVSSGDDYAMTFGSGCVDVASGTHVMSLDSDPPKAALNDWRGCDVGVGVVVLFDRDVPDGTDPQAAIEATPEVVVGGGESWAIIFTSGPCETVGWPGAFSGGYAVGRCETVPSDFDSFEPAPTGFDTVVRVVTDFDDLEWCNWT